jgi:hypothetical protein
MASAVGTAVGNYKFINLNGECPLSTVSGGQHYSGTALMKDETLVANCVEQMKTRIEAVIAGDHATLVLQSNTDLVYKMLLHLIPPKIA